MSQDDDQENKMETAITIEGIDDDAGRAAAARSTMYRHLAEWLRFPWQDFHEFARSGDLVAAASECAATLPFPLDVSSHLEGLAQAHGDYDEFQSAYVGLFDVGSGGPPCPLYGGTWGGDRQKTMEEALRFYRFFGLTLAPEERDLPDHIATELEFLHYLTFKEVEALKTGGDVSSLRRAARDFLLRHPARWLPRALAKLDKIDPPAFWRSIVALAADFCRADAAHLVTLEGHMKE